MQLGNSAIAPQPAAYENVRMPLGGWRSKGRSNSGEACPGAIDAPVYFVSFGGSRSQSCPRGTTIETADTGRDALLVLHAER
jgi:hypothetical protein